MITSTFQLKIALCAAIILAACSKSEKEGESAVTVEHNSDSANKNPTEGREATAQDDPRVKCAPGAKQHHITVPGVDDTIIIIQCRQEDGLPDGPSRAWTSHGVLVTDDNYAQGKPDGVQRSWSNDGFPIDELTYRNGQLEGRVRHWHPNGKLARELFFHLGEPTGIEREWDEKGHLIKAHRPGSKTKGTGDMQRARE